MLVPGVNRLINHLANIVEHLACKEADIRRWWRPKTELKEKMDWDLRYLTSVRRHLVSADNNKTNKAAPADKQLSTLV